MLCLVAGVEEGWEIGFIEEGSISHAITRVQVLRLQEAIYQDSYKCRLQPEGQAQVLTSRSLYSSAFTFLPLGPCWQSRETKAHTLHLQCCVRKRRLAVQVDEKGVFSQHRPERDCEPPKQERERAIRQGSRRAKDTETRVCWKCGSQCRQMTGGSERPGLKKTACHTGWGILRVSHVHTFMRLSQPLCITHNAIHSYEVDKQVDKAKVITSVSLHLWKCLRY